VTFKATSSSKGKAKQDTSSEDDDSSFDDMDDKKMTLFVKRFGKFMVKKGYRARRKKSSSKSKDETRRCLKCGNKDHLVAQCPYNSENKDDKKGKKKEKKDKKDKMTFKKMGDSYVVTWDSDASSSDDDNSDDDKTTKEKALASIAINEKPSLFDTLSTCFMAKATKVQTCDGCDEKYDNDSESDDDDEPTKDELIDMLEDTK
jgi:hypothetical protein